MEPFKIITELSKLRDFELDEDLPRVSPEDLTEDYEGIRERKASPASVIYPYYGKDFLCQRNQYATDFGVLFDISYI